jgi:hypothetical protein
MDTADLKIKIINRLIEIEDPNVLNSIDVLLNASDENIAKFLSIAFENIKENTTSETEDFTDYIKEWVKSM